MEPYGAHQGHPATSELFQSLQAYLKNKNRLQPIIGLDSITECVKAGCQRREAFYLCKVCICRHNKADMRNHIMGSLHRYNYIAAKQPCFVMNWKKEADLSKLARPLMEIAKSLEERDGPGNVQVLECEEVLYNALVSLDENNAVAFIRTIKCWQRDIRSTNPDPSLETDPPAQTDQRQRGTLPKKNPISTSEPSSTLISGETAACHDSYHPIIGLSCVVECRGEDDDQTYSFLCHCCRVRANKQDLMRHVTALSHLFNYMMEFHPQRVAAVVGDVTENARPLLQLAEHVEQMEGTGDIQVVKVPTSLCLPLTQKSYHWCIATIFGGYGRTGTNIQKRKEALPGSVVDVRQASNGNMLHMSPAQLSYPEKRAGTRARKKKSKVSTVFKVSLPLSKGAMLLKRTSFSQDDLPTTPGSLYPYQTEDFDTDFDPRDTSQRGVASEDTGEDMFSGQERKITYRLNVDGDGYVPNDLSPDNDRYASGPQQSFDLYVDDEQDRPWLDCSGFEDENFLGQREHDGSPMSSLHRESEPVVYDDQEVFGEVDYAVQWQQPIQSEADQTASMQREGQHLCHTVQNCTSPPAVAKGHDGVLPRDLSGGEHPIGSSNGSLEMAPIGPETEEMLRVTLWHTVAAPQLYTLHPASYRSSPLSWGLTFDRPSPEQPHLLLNSMNNSAMYTPCVHGYGIHQYNVNSRRASEWEIMTENVDCTPTHVFQPSPYTTASHLDYCNTAQNVSVSNFTQG